MTTQQDTQRDQLRALMRSQSSGLTEIERAAIACLMDEGSLTVLAQLLGKESSTMRQAAVRGRRKIRAALLAAA